MDPYALARDLVHEFPEYMGKSSMSWPTVLRIAEFAMNQMVIHEWIAEQDTESIDGWIEGQLPLFGITRNGAYVYTPEVFLK